MAQPRIVIVGAGPAGTRAAETLVAAGLRPIVIDEAVAGGGQIYRRQPGGFGRSYKTLYGFESSRAEALHRTFDALADRIDHRPETTVWNVANGALYTARAGAIETIPFDRLILATGATDRLLPIKGWTIPGCFSLGAAQIALKAQACGIGRRVVFFGTGPLLYLVASQYAKAGLGVQAVLDTAPFSAQVRAVPNLASRPDVLAKGLYYRAWLRARRISIVNGVAPVAVEGRDSVEGLRYRGPNGVERTVECDAIGMGFHLRSETQLADLARCAFVFDEDTRQWRPERDPDGRSSVPGVYLAGDGADILGADAAEIGGRLAALALLADLGHAVDPTERSRLLAKQKTMDRFRRGLLTAFPWPAHLARAVADDVILCRCEAITAGHFREAATGKDAPELNRAKAFSRVGMGRCQGRFCGSAAAEILSAARGEALETAGRIRGQAPIKPLGLSHTRAAPAPTP